MVESGDVLRVKRRTWVRDTVLVKVVHLVEAGVIAERLGAAWIHWDAVRSGDAFWSVQVEAGARDLSSGKVIDSTVIFTSCSTGGREADGRSGARPVVVIVGYLNPVKSVVALESDRDGRPSWRGILCARTGTPI